MKSIQTENQEINLSWFIEDTMICQNKTQRFVKTENKAKQTNKKHVTLRLQQGFRIQG